MKNLIAPFFITLTVISLYSYSKFEEKNSKIIECGNRNCFITQSILGKYKYHISVKSTIEANDEQLKNSENGLNTISIYASTGNYLKSKNLNDAILEVNKIEN